MTKEWSVLIGFDEFSIAVITEHRIVLIGDIGNRLDRK